MSYRISSYEITLRFLSKCLRMDTAFLIRQYKSSGKSGARPLALSTLKILLPVTKRTWATPCESRRMTPGEKNNKKKEKTRISHRVSLVRVKQIFLLTDL